MFVFFGLMQIEGSFGEPVLVISIFEYCAKDILKEKSVSTAISIKFFILIILRFKINKILSFHNNSFFISRDDKFAGKKYNYIK